MGLGMKWLVATNGMKDAGDQNALDAQSLRTINIYLPKCFASMDEAFEYILKRFGAFPLATTTF